MTTIERRQRRSTNPISALSFQLHACRDRAQVQAMVLSDPDGLCLAAAGENECTAAEIAAQLPIQTRRDREFEGIIPTESGPRQVRCRRFPTALGSLFVCAVGPQEHSEVLPLEASAAGIRRILSS